MSRASMANEGKIHLGFVYAADKEGITPQLMLDGALCFASLIEEWSGARIPWQRLRSRPFVYGIARDSMVEADRLVEAYTALQSSYEGKRLDPGAHYLGRRPDRLWREADNGLRQRVPHSDFVVRFIETEEVSLAPRKFRACMADVLEDTENITPCYGHDVREIFRVASGFRVEGERSDGAGFSTEAEVLVNCLWDQRLRFDRQLGIEPPRPWVHRLKFRVGGRLPPGLHELPSFTYVLGPFGDIVCDDDGWVDLSWYPVCRRGWSGELAPPREWEDMCRGRLDRATADSISRATLESLDRIVPGIRDTRVERVEGGTIFSWGASDIHNPESALHARHEIGVSAHYGYFSINTGKFTTAPLFAKHLADQLS